MVGTIVHGGGLALAAARFGGSVEDWLDLSTGINPCPPALPTIDPRIWHRLPDLEREDDARLAARDFYNSGSILPLPVPGTQSAIQLLPRLLGSGQRAAILSPTYGEYGRSLALTGLDVDCIADLDDIRDHHGLVVVVNPNNPTGRAFAPDSLLVLASRLKTWGGIVVVDEAFGDCQPDLSVASFVEQHDNLIVFRSFGKFFGMAGVRLGFVIASNGIQQSFAEGLGPWAVSGPALALASALLRADRAVIQRQITLRKQALDGVLNGAGLKIMGGTSLFSLVSCEQAKALHEHLCNDHILTRIFDYASDWLRIGLAPDTSGDERLAHSLRRWCQKGEAA
ncbi:threonine-phosphate decarboxylase CobD [Rhizobium sp.]|jgi:cobalamin biosynthesis protein CobC|uniref:threonine-phosphate decarboxylase CobD n=1 Tax=Rhizobium sp. TaxID=391 RepID=UPI000E91E94E|nr:threonine-phosphate decarboxylase [Rhizobium sp.]